MTLSTRFFLPIAMLLSLPIGNLAIGQSTGSFLTSYTVNGSAHDLAWYVPTTYSSSNQYRLVVGLHGCGGSGVAYRNTLRNLSDSLDAIIVCPDNSGNQMSGAFSALITEAITTAQTDYSIDGTAVYLTGFSCNGQETFKHGLNNIYAFRGIIPFNSWLPSVNPADYNNYQGQVRTCVCSGTVDGSYNQNLSLHDSLSANGVETYWNSMPGIPHTTNFPEFDAEMMECFNWIDNSYNTAVSVGERYLKNTFKVFPNPSNGHLSVEWTGAKSNQNLTWEWLDLQGRTVQIGNFSSPSTGAVYSLQLDGIRPGMYLLRISGTEGAQIARVRIN